MLEVYTHEALEVRIHSHPIVSLDLQLVEHQMPLAI